MYMGPIAAAKAPASPLLRRATGVPVLLIAVLMMLPWLAGNALVAGIVLGARGIVAAPRALVSAIDYAGAVALGR